MPEVLIKNLVSLPSLNHFCIARHDVYTGPFGSPFYSDQNIPEFGHRQALFQDKPQRQILRDGSAHRQIVDGAVNRQFANIAARKEHGRDNVAIGAERHTARQVQYSTVVVSIEQWITEQIKNTRFEQFIGQNTPAAVPERNNVEIEFRHGTVKLHVGWFYVETQPFASR